MPATVVFLHAHPDDEAIFTGGTMALLAERGHRVVLVVATSGELGVPHASGAELGGERQQETVRCCRSLGVDEVLFLGFADSGLAAENPHGFVHTPLEQVVAAAVDSIEPLGRIDALVSYDDHGIYGHPDHVKVHELGRALQQRLDVATLYESTVDREYLHFVETHVVVEAGLGERPIGRGLAASDLGMPSVLIDVAVDARPALPRKRAAMADHASQLPADAPVFALGQQNFAAVYGFEWYVRRGVPGPIDELPHA